MAPSRISGDLMKSIRLAKASTPLGAVLISITAGVVAGFVVWLVGFAMAGTTDGVPLFTPGAPLAENDPIRQSPETKLPNFVRLRPIVSNGAAPGANAVTVEIDGKVHSFAMHLQPRRDEMLKRYGGDHQARWLGEGAYDGFTVRPVIDLSKDDVTGNLAGSIFLPPRAYS